MCHIQRQHDNVRAAPLELDAGGVSQQQSADSSDMNHRTPSQRHVYAGRKFYAGQQVHDCGNTVSAIVNRR
jgi:hypothetical protein